MSSSPTTTTATSPAWYQKRITLKPRRRGCHIITREIMDNLGEELKKFQIGIANVFLMHTSASIQINENYSSDVPVDMENALNRLVPENGVRYQHDDEGPDDMPAHIKSAVIGTSLTIPITNGKFALGTWQGIWLCEHRNYGGARKVTVTLQGVQRQ